MVFSIYPHGVDVRAIQGSLQHSHKGVVAAFVSLNRGQEAMISYVIRIKDLELWAY
jgi:hypothetical protein